MIGWVTQYQGSIVEVWVVWDSGGGDGVGMSMTSSNGDVSGGACGGVSGCAFSTHAKTWRVGNTDKYIDACSRRRMFLSSTHVLINKTASRQQQQCKSTHTTYASQPIQHLQVDTSSMYIYESTVRQKPTQPRRKVRQKPAQPSPSPIPSQTEASPPQSRRKSAFVSRPAQPRRKSALADASPTRKKFTAESKGRET